MQNNKKTRDQLIEELKMLQEEVRVLKKETMQDHLTGLFNRRYLDKIIISETSRAKRSDQSIGFIMVDINLFKEVNDTLGHQKGDALLKEIAMLLQQATRKMDTIIRYGGDEFLIIAPIINGGLTSLVQRIRNIITEWNKGNKNIGFPITLSIGTSTWNSNIPDNSIKDVIHKADKAMYQDKEQQRNSFV